MDKLLIIAKIRRWQAELREMVAALQEEGKGGPILEILQKRATELEELIVAIRDRSFIPKGDVSFEPTVVVEEIGDKVKKVKEGVKRLKALKEEKKKIIDEMKED